MRTDFAFTAFLAHIAALATAAPACTTTMRGFCTDVPPEKDITVDSGVACAMAFHANVTGYPPGSPATDNGGDSCLAACSGQSCTLPSDYVQAYQNAQPPDAGLIARGDELLPVCPAVTGTVPVKCQTFCEGRRTDGIEEPLAAKAMWAGEYFAASSYLEAVSVHAFARLAAELISHGAPAELVNAARRGQRDEVRHAHATRALARHFGVPVKWPARRRLAVRSLAAMAIENAVEGCVRETYGAALAYARALRAADDQVRDVMRSIARDECKHAELSWKVAAWAMPRLTPREREVMRAAMRAAARELLSGGDDELDAATSLICGMPSRGQRRRMAALLDDTLFRSAA